jgi:hypothetical protein
MLYIPQAPPPQEVHIVSSQAQINANRLNSQKSTGPITPEGKAATSLNALKTGIHARSHIIPGEDPAALEALTAAFLLQFQPTDANQLALVDTLIAAEWTQRRLRRIEAELWNSRDESLDPTYAELSATPPNPTSPFPSLGHSYPDALDPFIRIQRRIDSTNRMYLRTLQVLQALVGAGQLVRPKPDTRPEPAARPEPPSAAETQPLAPPIGFVPPLTPAPSEGPPVTAPQAVHPAPGPRHPAPALMKPAKIAFNVES